MEKKNPTSPLIEKIQIKTKHLTKTEKPSGITAEAAGELELEAAGRNNNSLEISRRHTYNS